MNGWREAARLLRHPACQGVGGIHLVGREPFFDEGGLPFNLEGGGTVCHLVPDPGFRKEHLAGSADERLLIADCPDAEGWLVPADLVRDWMAHHLHHDRLEDLLLSHPLYEYLTTPDEEGRSRGGRIPLVQWAPGLPTLANLLAPEFLPDDEEAPALNRERDAYAHALVGLLEALEREFSLVELELSIRFGAAGRPKGRARHRQAGVQAA